MEELEKHEGRSWIAILIVGIIIGSIVGGIFGTFIAFKILQFSPGLILRLLLKLSKVTLLPFQQTLLIYRIKSKKLRIKFLPL